MTLPSTPSKHPNATEAEYQAVLVGLLPKTHKGLDSEKIQEYVAIPGGEIDVLTPKTIFECKRMLTRDALLQALGQLQLYRAACPGHEKLAIAGPLPDARQFPKSREVAKATMTRIQDIGVEIHVLPRMEPGSCLREFLLSKELTLSSAEIIAVEEIASSCEQSMESLIDRLEKLTWGDGLLEFKMQSGIDNFPEWMTALGQLSHLVNQRLVASGIPLGPSLKAYQHWSSQG